MTLSRDKGKRGEVELVKLYETHGYTAKRTAAMQAADDETFADVTAWCGPLTVATEVKNRQSLPPVGVMKAIEQADGAFPGSPNVARVVAMRQQGQPGKYIFAMREAVFFDLLARIRPEGESSQ